MKKITFKVTSKTEGSFVSLIKKVDKISCRIQIDFENNLVTVEDMNNTMIDSVIELVDEYYSISNVTIDNTSDESTLVENSQSVTVAQESKSEGESKSNLTVVGPQSEDDLIIQKVTFKNDLVEDVINRFLRTAYWAMHKKGASEKEIADFIWNSINEISMKYNPTIIDYSVGDIVECNYGYHLGGEVNGGHVFALVCNKLECGMAYLVPIFKIKKNLYSISCLSFNVPNDVVYNDYYCNSGVALLDKGKFVREERIIDIIGRATPEFMTKVLDKLSTTFDFRDNMVMNDNTKTDFVDEVVELQEDIAGAETNVAMDKETVEVTSKENLTACDAVETNSIAADNADVTTTEPKSKPKKAVKRIGKEESALLNIIGGSLEKIDPTKTVEEQVSDFLSDIGMTTSDNLVNQAFVVSVYVNKIYYENVVSELHYMFPEVNECKIKSILQKSFKNWLKSYPELVENCPKISLISLLRVFAKRFASNNSQNN